ncbi:MULTISPECIES: MFS transporter [unclassified Paraflavitalea]|uniref:MFS transporter n=1 Tax=unclassified Paraflavitalea TaxID=2798305 RepID=UPI003D358763
MAQHRPIVYRTSVSVFFFCCGLTFATWAARIPNIKDQFQLDEAALGAVLFMLPFGSLVALPIAGWAVSHFGSRIITYLSAILYAAFLVALGYAPTVGWLSGFLFMFGFWGDVLNISVNTQALEAQQQFYEKPLMSSFHGLWSIGALGGAFFGGLFMKANTTTVFHFNTMAIIIALLATVFLFYMVPKDKIKSEEHKIFALPDKSLLLLGAICFCCALCEGAMADWSSLYYKQVVNNLKAVSTTGYTAFAFCMAAGRLIGDKVTIRLGYKGVMFLDSFLISAGLALAIFAATPIAVIIGFGLVGFGVATIIPNVYSLAGRSKTMAPSTALAAVSTLGFSGFLIGPPMIGFIAHETGLRWALITVLILGLVIALFSRKVKEPA